MGEVLQERLDHHSFPCSLSLVSISSTIVSILTLSSIPFLAHCISHKAVYIQFIVSVIYRIPLIIKTHYFTVSSIVYSLFSAIHSSKSHDATASTNNTNKSIFRYFKFSFVFKISPQFTSTTLSLAATHVAPTSLASS